MVNFLIHRPIAVLMSFLALIIFSMIAINQLPISLLPDTEVPKLTVTVAYPNASPQKIEQNVLSPIRDSFGTLSGLKSTESNASYEFGSVDLSFSYNTSMNLAYIAANEKMDRLMSLLPPDLDRPQIVKANTTDIPVIKINATPNMQTDMVSLSKLAENVIKKRLEQVEGVSLVDINGKRTTAIVIQPDRQKLLWLKLTTNDLIAAIRQSNRSLGSVSVKDGQYRYYIKIKNLISDVASVRSLTLQTASGQTVRIDQIAEIIEKESKPSGYHLFNDKEGLVFNVHKQASARMVDLVPLLKKQVKLLNNDYPQVTFTTTQDQSTLLNVSISNLTNSLIIGGICAFIILFVFMANAKIPLIIGISLPISLLLAFLLFWALDLSINIVSLSGLALGLGMLIDNAIIVIDNITRKRAEGLSLTASCIEGVEEVISPLISSVLTTLSVFIPLIFLGGISGTLFYDQALSVAAILGVSLLVAFILLPVLYQLFFKKGGTIKEHGWAFNKIKAVYKNQYKWLIKRPTLFIVSIIIFVITGLYLGQQLETEGLPSLNQPKKLLTVDWNAPITIAENKKRTLEMIENLPGVSQSESDIGVSQFLLQSEKGNLQSAQLLLEVDSRNVAMSIGQYFVQNYPQASYELKEAPNAFDQIFVSDKPYLEARFRSTNKSIPASFSKEVPHLIDEVTIAQKTGFQQQSIVRIFIDYDKLGIYNISQEVVLTELNQLFGRYKISEIKSFNEVTPIYLNGIESGLRAVLNKATVANRDGQPYPLSYFVKPAYATDFKQVVADQTGRYQSFEFNKTVSVNDLQERLKQVANEKGYLVSFTGQYFEDKDNLSRLTLVLSISIMLLYFILVAQFESFSQPLIVILTLPIGIAGSLFMLYITSSTINIMSSIGIIVMLGVIVNDSILKIDTINRLRHQGKTTMEALWQAGSMRLKPILMTSITTILALLPILFFSGLGSTLQSPLVYAVIGGLTVGTLASVFVIPVLYKFLAGSSS